MSSEPEKLDDAIADTLATIQRLAEHSARRERENPALAAQRDSDERALVIRTASQVLIDHGVPARVVRQLADGGWRETSAVAKIRSWHAMHSWCAVLGGDFGVGKSFAAALWLWLIAFEAAEAKRTSTYRAPECWRSAADLARIGNYDRNAFNEVARLPALVIDDLGAEFNDGKGAFLAFLGDLLNERQSNERRTLITTNLAGSAFKERYGQRIIERIREGGVFEGVTGPNMRVSVQERLPLDPAPHPTEVEPREGRFTVRQSHYRLRIRTPRARARRNQMAFAFADARESAASRSFSHTRPRTPAPMTGGGQRARNNDSE